MTIFQFRSGKIDDVAAASGLYRPVSAEGKTFPGPLGVQNRGQISAPRDRLKRKNRGIKPRRLLIAAQSYTGVDLGTGGGAGLKSEPNDNQILFQPPSPETRGNGRERKTCRNQFMIQQRALYLLQIQCVGADPSGPSAPPRPSPSLRPPPPPPRR